MTNYQAVIIMLLTLQSSPSHHGSGTSVNQVYNRLILNISDAHRAIVTRLFFMFLGSKVVCHAYNNKVSSNVTCQPFSML